MLCCIKIHLFFPSLSDIPEYKSREDPVMISRCHSRFNYKGRMYWDMIRPYLETCITVDGLTDSLWALTSLSLAGYDWQKDFYRLKIGAKWVSGVFGSQFKYGVSGEWMPVSSNAIGAQESPEQTPSLKSYTFDLEKRLSVNDDFNFSLFIIWLQKTWNITHCQQAFMMLLVLLWMRI